MHLIKIHEFVNNILILIKHIIHEFVINMLIKIHK